MPRAPQPPSQASKQRSHTRPECSAIQPIRQPSAASAKPPRRPDPSQRAARHDQGKQASERPGHPLGLPVSPLFGCSAPRSSAAEDEIDEPCCLAEPTLFWPQQKIVIRVSLASEKTRSKAMALVARADGTRAQALRYILPVVRSSRSTLSPSGADGACVCVQG